MMVFENFSDFISQFSLENFVRGDFTGVSEVFYLVVSMAIYSIFVWHFYRFIARRDCFKISMKKHPRVIGFLKYAFVYPIIAFLFFLGFSLIMNFLTSNYDTDALLSTSFAIVIAIRITAYYSEDLSKDLAKMLPFALLGIFLVDPSYFDFGSQSLPDMVNTIPTIFNKGAQFILFIIVIEWVLRILLTIRYMIIPPKQEPSEAE